MLTVWLGRCNKSMPRSDAEARQGTVRAVVNEVARERGAGVLDLWPVICPSGVCQSYEGGLYRYRDATHISVRQSEALAADFAAAIAGAP